VAETGSNAIEMGSLLGPAKSEIFRVRSPHWTDHLPGWVHTNLLPDRMKPQPLSLNCKNNKGETPLMIASADDQIDVVKVLLEKCVNLGVLDNDGNNALEHAVKNGASEVVKELLVKYGPSWREYGMSLVYLSVAGEMKDNSYPENETENRKKTLDLLLQQGANSDGRWRLEDGTACIQKAVQEVKYGAVKLLKKKMDSDKEKLENLDSSNELCIELNEDLQNALLMAQRMVELKQGKEHEAIKNIVDILSNKREQFDHMISEAISHLPSINHEEKSNGNSGWRKSIRKSLSSLGKRKKKAAITEGGNSAPEEKEEDSPKSNEASAIVAAAEVSDITNAVEVVVERGEKLGEVEKRTEQMASKGKIFADNAKKLLERSKREYESKKWYEW
jgi:hypothetical protein